MFRLSTVSFVVATLLGSFAICAVAEAQSPRSPIDRRHRPQMGFWQSSPSSSSAMRSAPSSSQQLYAGRSNRSVQTPTVVQRRTVAPATVVQSPRVIAPTSATTASVIVQQPVQRPLMTSTPPATAVPSGSTD